PHCRLSLRSCQQHISYQLRLAWPLPRRRRALALPSVECLAVSTPLAFPSTARRADNASAHLDMTHRLDQTALHAGLTNPSSRVRFHIRRSARQVFVRRRSGQPSGAFLIHGTSWPSTGPARAERRSCQSGVTRQTTVEFSERGIPMATTQTGSRTRPEFRAP